MKKLSAFTLIELLIGMIISSIVIGFGYAAYSLIYKQYLSYKQVKEKVVEITLFKQVLSTDMQQAAIISFSENTLSLLNKNKNPLEYHFYDDFIVRKEKELSDTFKISASNVKTNFLFQDQLIFVNEFSFDANVLDEKEHFTFAKNYSSETLMNYEPLTKNQ
jgi:prepilin-type N-terminal cleavage/methylation domain-containing protein